MFFQTEFEITHTQKSRWALLRAMLEVPLTASRYRINDGVIGPWSHSRR